MTVKSKEINIDRVVIGGVTSSPNLDVYFRVRDYICSIRLVNYMTRVRILNTQSKYGTDLRKVLNLAFTQTIKSNDMLINCTCPDFYYRFSYAATVNNYGFNTNQIIPARIRNPKNEGSGCKHLMRIINASYLWKSKVITAVLHAIQDDPSLL